MTWDEFIKFLMDRRDANMLWFCAEVQGLYEAMEDLDTPTGARVLSDVKEYIKTSYLELHPVEPT